MNKFIKGIIVFKDNEHKSLVQFNEGINIITGDSKTGKSALIDIIDYCLCSRSNTVPKGVIKNYANLFVIVLYINNRNIAIARRQNDGKMSIKYFNSDIDIDKIKLKDFETFSKAKDIQAVIEENLGLDVTNVDINPFERKKGKASLRNMVSYNFQHQNNIANKFALFYRFDDSEKREQVIDQFPIFAGIVNQKYYSTLIELRDVEQNHRNLLRRKELEENSYSKIFRELLPLLEEYYALIGQEIPKYVYEADYNGLIQFAENLPTEDYYFINSDITEKYSSFKKNAEKLSDEVNRIKLKIEDLKESNDDISSYLNSIMSAMYVTGDRNYSLDYKCPLCNSLVKDIESDKSSLEISVKHLIEEKKFAENASSHFIEEKRKLAKLLDDKKKELKAVLKEIKYIEDNYLNNTELKDKYEKTIKAKVRINYSLEILMDKSYLSYNDELLKLEEKMKELKELISEYNVDKEMAIINKEIDDNMNRLASGLDFEDDFKPTNLHFNINTFDLYHNTDEGKISLGEMGSGANWLSCHIALFLSLLRVFTKRHNKSPMLLFLFLDQPSQVYFPDNQKIDETSDIVAISNIFRTIFDEVKSIEDDTGIKPQIIITEHVKGNVLKNVGDDYNKYTIKNWSDSNGKFINLND